MPPKRIKHKVDITQRRLDELALLIETGVCSAVSIFGDRFIIAANEFFDKNLAKNQSGTALRTGNQQLNTICSTMEYFKKIANGEYKDERTKVQERDVLMQRMLKYSVGRAAQAGIRLGDKIVKKVVRTKHIRSEILPNHPYIQRRKGLAYLALGQGCEIYKRFAKIEQNISDAKAKVTSEGNDDGGGITNIQLKAFESFSYLEDSKKRLSSDILFLPKDEDKNVHAEAQIVNKIVIDIEGGAAHPGKIYIGISKLCCMNCHCLLEAAKEVLQNEPYNCLLEYRGAHNADFSTSWGRPPIFVSIDLRSAGRGQRNKKAGDNTVNLSLSEKIYERYKYKLRQHQHTPERPVIAEEEQSSQESYDQRGTPSSSEAGAVIIERYKDELLEKLKVLQQFQSYPFEQAKTLLNLGIKLCDKSKQFEQLFEIKEVIAGDLVIETVCNEFSIKQSGEISGEDLRTFLSNPDFSGESISKILKWDFEAGRDLENQNAPGSGNQVQPASPMCFSNQAGGQKRKRPNGPEVLSSDDDHPATSPDDTAAEEVQVQRPLLKKQQNKKRTTG